MIDCQWVSVRCVKAAVQKVRASAGCQHAPAPLQAGLLGAHMSDASQRLVAKGVPSCRRAPRA
jgi:hypothetical protein